MVLENKPSTQKWVLLFMEKNYEGVYMRKV